MPTSEDELEARRWEMLRWAPRHDSGALYYPGHDGEVWVQSVATVVPFLVVTGDFAPADMQYRMHREHLWHPATGLYGERYDVDNARWVTQEPTAVGNASVAVGLATALRTGGDATPSEMRGRWIRETNALLEAISALELDDESRSLLEEATAIGTIDGWLRGQP